MAGVIASVSLETRNKENGNKPKRQIHINKSTYIIPTFDRHFQPSKHNIFFKRSVNSLWYHGTPSFKSLFRRANYLLNQDEESSEQSENSVNSNHSTISLAETDKEPPRKRGCCGLVAEAVCVGAT